MSWPNLRCFQDDNEALIAGAGRPGAAWGYDSSTTFTFVSRTRCIENNLTVLVEARNRDREILGDARPTEFRNSNWQFDRYFARRHEARATEPFFYLRVFITPCGQRRSFERNFTRSIEEFSPREEQQFITVTLARRIIHFSWTYNLII